MLHMNKYFKVVLFVILFSLLVQETSVVGFSCNTLIETPYLLSNDVNQRLKKLSTSSVEYYLYGVYSRNMDYLFGNYLYLFPNKLFVVTEWCDVCKEHVINRGAWKFSENKVIFKSKSRSQTIYFSESLIDTRSEMNLFVIGDDKKIEMSILIDDHNLQEIGQSKENIEYLVRIEAYINWEKDYKRFYTSPKPQESDE